MKKRIIILAGILAVLLIASGCSSKDKSSQTSGTTQITSVSTTAATSVSTTAPTTTTTSSSQTTAPAGDFTKEQALDALKKNVEVFPGGMFAFDHMTKENNVEYYMVRYYTGSGTIAWFDVQKDNGKIFILNLVTNKLVEYVPGKTDLYNPQ